MSICADFLLHNPDKVVPLLYLNLNLPTSYLLMTEYDKVVLSAVGLELNQNEVNKFYG
jgi:hypothetical protein